MPKKKEVKKGITSKQLKPEIKKEIRKQVEKEVDEAQDEVTQDVRKEVKKDLKRHFDPIDRVRRMKYHNKFFFTLIVAFGVIAFWRGLWMLMDELIFPGFPVLSGTFTVLLGLTILAASGALLKVFD